MAAASNSALEKAILAKVPQSYQGDCLRLVRGELFTYAQAWQDWYMFHNLFSRKAWGEGYYVDVGADDPVWISNTLFFDRCLGWKGLCFEPQSKFHAGFRQHRTCEVMPTCVASSNVTINLIGEGGTAMLASANEVIAAAAKGAKTATFTCTILADELRKRQIKHVDFISIDIEGSEPSVIAGFPFDEIRVDNWLVEVNKLEQRVVDAYFARSGYVNSQTLLNRRGRMATPLVKAWLDVVYTKRHNPVKYPVGKFVCDSSQRAYRTHDCTAFDLVVGTNADISHAKLRATAEEWGGRQAGGACKPAVCPPTPRGLADACPPTQECPPTPACPPTQECPPPAGPGWLALFGFALLTGAVGYVIGNNSKSLP